MRERTFPAPCAPASHGAGALVHPGGGGRQAGRHVRRLPFLFETRHQLSAFTRHVAADFTEQLLGTTQRPRRRSSVAKAAASYGVIAENRPSPWWHQPSAVDIRSLSGRAETELAVVTAERLSKK